MSDSTNINDLFRQAHAEGLLSDTAAQTLVVANLGAEIQASLGVPVEDVPYSEVILLTQMPDDSGSIASAGKEQVVRDGHNQVLDALTGSRQRNNILAHTRYLNGHVLFPFCFVDQAIRMTAGNYSANQGTPLYDQAVATLATVLAGSLRFSNNGVVARTITLIITDGLDQHSRQYSAADVAALVSSMRCAETHIVAAMGIGDDPAAFRRIFHEMGIDDRWILTPGDDPKAIRDAFGLISRSAVRASQATGGFSQTLLGGFA